MHRSVATIAMIALLACVSHDRALAEMSITGSRDQITLQARDASLDDVLRALRDRYGLIYRNNAPEGQAITGSYRGSLESVVGEVTRRYDRALKTKNGTVELIMTNQVKSTAKPLPMPRPEHNGASTVTATLDSQARQILAFNAGGAAPGSAAAIDTTSGARTGAPIGAAPPSPQPALTSRASMAELTQRASSSVRELVQALNSVSIRE
jgi:hypothetical protein